MKTTLLLFLCLLLGFEASAKQPKLSPDIKHADLAAVIPVIVQYEHEPNDADHQMILTMGGQLKGKLKSVKAGAYKVPGSALASIAADPNVRYVSLDRPVHAKLDYSTAAVNASVAWRSGYNGTGIGVAVIDSGTTPVGDFTDKKNRILYTQDFVYKDGKDQYGHGEHVAGIIAASGKGSNCSHCNRALKGVAPDANLINFRVLDENG
jgi:serine protease AprX